MFLFREVSNMGVYRYKVEILKPFSIYRVGQIVEMTERDGGNIVPLLVSKGYIRIIEREYIPTQTSIERWL